jgi:hypothetical protein
MIIGFNHSIIAGKEVIRYDRIYIEKKRGTGR